MRTGPGLIQVNSEAQFVEFVYASCVLCQQKTLNFFCWSGDAHWLVPKKLRFDSSNGVVVALPVIQDFHVMDVRPLNPTEEATRGTNFSEL